MDIRPCALQVTPVVGAEDMARFIRVPWRIYADDPAWVPPLLAERRQHLSAKNPFFEHAKWRAWIAYRGKTAVGRICAQVDRLHLERHRDAAGFFGMLEGEDDAALFGALLETAEGWLREQGMRMVRGPFSLSINQESGLLVEGFDTPPMVMMGHARPYYPGHIEAHGYTKARDLLAYWLDLSFEVPKSVRRIMRQLGGRARERPLRRAEFNHDMEILRDIFNDAWSDNWGFVPFTQSEFAHLGRALKFLITDECVQIVELDGEPVAMMVWLPNVNEALRDLNGRLLPHGWLKLLWRLKVRFPRAVRVLLLGVRRRLQGGPLGAALPFMLIEASRRAAVKRGVRAAELSWILEDNRGVCSIIESIGGVPYKRYRVYEKELV